MGYGTGDYFGVTILGLRVTLGLTFFLTNMLKQFDIKIASRSNFKTTVRYFYFVDFEMAIQLKEKVRTLSQIIMLLI